MKEEKITDISEYIDKIKAHSEKKEMVIYRGYSSKKEMWPTIVRSFVSSKCYKTFWEDHKLSKGLKYKKVKHLEHYANWDKPTSVELKKLFQEYEETLFGSFKRQARAYTSHTPSNDWEWWLALAQHRGLPTRLLDWTKNPLAALYFSLQGKKKKKKDQCCYVSYVTLGALGSGHLHMVNGKKRKKFPSPLTYCDSPNRYLPPAVDRRIVQQDAVFTIQDNPLYPILDEWKSESRHIDYGRYVISYDHRDTLIDQLYALGIDQAMLFPSVDDLCSKLNWVWTQHKTF